MRCGVFMQLSKCIVFSICSVIGAHNLLAMQSDPAQAHKIEAIPSISDQLIAAKKKALASFLQKRSWVRMGAKIAMLAGAGVIAYKWFTSGPAKPVAQVAGAVTVALPAVLATTPIETMDQIAQQITGDPNAKGAVLIPFWKTLYQAYQRAQNPVVQPQVGFFRWLGGSLVGGAVGGISFISRQTLGMIFLSAGVKMNQLFLQEPNLAWFIATRTQWQSTVGALEAMAQFETIPLDLFSVHFEQAVEDVAAQIAFMQYVVEQLPADKVRDKLELQVEKNCLWLRKHIDTIAHAYELGDSDQIKAALQVFLAYYSVVVKAFNRVEIVAGITDGIGQHIMKFIDVLPAILGA